MAFAFELNEPVQVRVEGTVIARGEYVNGESQYLVRYVDGDNTVTEAWFAEGALTPKE